MKSEVMEILDIIYPRLSPIHQKAMMLYVRDHKPEEWTDAQKVALYRHWMARIEGHTERCFKKLPGAEDRACMLEVDDGLPRWQAEDIALGREG